MHHFRRSSLWICLCLALPQLLAADDAPVTALDDRDKLLAVHRTDAASYAMFRDATKRVRLTLKPEPVYRWSNPTRSGGQVGDVFIWTDEGRAEAIATIFSHPENGRRVLCHELHSLSTSVIVPDRPGTNRWQPRGGVTMRVMTPAPEPADTAVKRLIQLRNLARDFLVAAATNEVKNGNCVCCLNRYIDTKASEVMSSTVRCLPSSRRRVPIQKSC